MFVDTTHSVTCAVASGNALLTLSLVGELRAPHCSLAIVREIEPDLSPVVEASLTLAWDDVSALAAGFAALAGQVRALAIEPSHPAGKTPPRESTRVGC